MAAARHRIRERNVNATHAEMLPEPGSIEIDGETIVYDGGAYLLLRGGQPVGVVPAMDFHRRFQIVDRGPGRGRRIHAG